MEHLLFVCFIFIFFGFCFSFFLFFVFFYFDDRRAVFVTVKTGIPGYGVSGLRHYHGSVHQSVTVAFASVGVKEAV